jgi:hypothetical protein
MTYPVIFALQLAAFILSATVTLTAAVGCYYFLRIIFHKAAAEWEQSQNAIDERAAVSQEFAEWSRRRLQSGIPKDGQGDEPLLDKDEYI